MASPFPSARNAAINSNGASSRLTSRSTCTPGKNVIAASVWNYGDDAPYALMSVNTGFILQGDDRPAEVVNTDKSWRVLADASYTARPVERAKLHSFFAVGPGENIDGAKYPWNWTTPQFDDSHWAEVKVLGQGTPERIGTDLSWWLAPRNIPMMEEIPQRLARVRRSENAQVPENFVAGQSPITIAPHTKATILFDQNFETNAFPHLVVSQGRSAKIVLTYAEALFDDKGAKGPRDEIEGRHIAGVEDEFISGGGAKQDFSTLNFRTYRFLQADIETSDEPLQIDDLYGVATGYPFKEMGSFSSSDPSLSKIWEVGWRTARLCAGETYYDCPYYEQLQYVGDTRIQALISLYVGGDDRLVRNAIELFDRSRLPIGLTQSRYPSESPQIIPTFSLFWVQMVHDYWMHRRDDAFVRQNFLGIQNVLTWYEQHVDHQTGLLGPLPYWCFVDWTADWPRSTDDRPGGAPKGIQEGGSAIVTLHFAWTLDNAAELMESYDQPELAKHYRDLSSRLKRATIEKCWDSTRNVLADTPAKTAFSQHANALAVLSGAIEGPDAKDLIQRVADDASLTPCTLYFRFYLLRALKRAGLGDEYLARLGPWRDMLTRGLTTFAEKPDPTRSDCHAWSASPCYEFLATVCGVEPAAAGFARVQIQPHLGELTSAEANIPHPAGMIHVSYKRSGDALQADVTLPENVTGEIIWRGNTHPLHGGEQHVEL